MHLARAMKAPRIRESAGVLAERARAEGWTHEHVAVAAMVDRLVHHAEIINLKGDSYRLKDRRKEVTNE